MPKRIQKSITLDMKKLETFERHFPTVNFSRWVEDRMGEFIASKGGKPATKAKPHTPVISERKHREQEDAAFLRGVEEMLESDPEKVHPKALERYKQLKEAQEND